LNDVGMCGRRHCFGTLAKLKASRCFRGPLQEWQSGKFVG
jgi:hypothetical protein